MKMLMHARLGLSRVKKKNFETMTANMYVYVYENTITLKQIKLAGLGFLC